MLHNNSSIITNKKSLKKPRPVPEGKISQFPEGTGRGLLSTFWFYIILRKSGTCFNNGSNTVEIIKPESP